MPPISLFAGCARLSSLLRIASVTFIGVLIGSAADLSLRYDKPAPDTPQGWEKEALPIGNGRIGAMLFGGIERERIQFNDISLWTGDAQVMGSYQAFGDVFINLPGHSTGASAYLRELDLEQGLHRVTYKKGDINYRREVFASHPAQTIIVRLSADKPGAYTGSIELADMHDARLVIAHNRFYSVGSLAGFVLPPRARRNQPAPPPSAPSSNVMDYEAQAQVINEGGTLVMDDKKISFTGCDSLTIILGAGTSYVIDASRDFQGEHPHRRVTAQVDAAAAKSLPTLLAEHQADYNALFGSCRHRPWHRSAGAPGSHDRQTSRRLYAGGKRSGP